MFTINNAFIKGYGSILGGIYAGRTYSGNETESLNEDFETVAEDMHNVFKKESEKIDLANDKKSIKDK